MTPPQPPEPLTPERVIARLKSLRNECDYSIALHIEDDDLAMRKQVQKWQEWLAALDEAADALEALTRRIPPRRNL